MRKLWAAIAVVAMIAVAAIALVGWDLTRDRYASIPVPLPSPTIVLPTGPVPTSAATPVVVATSSPIRLATPTPLATPASPDPGPATLASGTEIQNGKHGYTYWCARDAIGACVMSERYGGPVPLDTLHVSPGATLAFAYRGPEPLASIASMLYPLAGAGSGEYPTLRGGMPVLTAQTDRQATLTAPASPGEYVIVVRITGDANTTADFQFHIAVA